MPANLCGKPATTENGDINEPRRQKTRKKRNRLAVATLPLVGPRTGIPPYPPKYPQFSVGG